MRVCPKCGYIDPAYWKHTKYSYHVDWSTLENFKIMFPKLKIKKGKIISDDLYYYRLSKSGTVVHRIAKIDVVDKPFGSHKYEKFTHRHYDKRFRKWLIHEIRQQKKLFPDEDT